METTVAISKTETHPRLKRYRDKKGYDSFDETIRGLLNDAGLAEDDPEREIARLQERVIELEATVDDYEQKFDKLNARTKMLREALEANGISLDP